MIRLQRGAGTEQLRRLLRREPRVFPLAAASRVWFWAGIEKAASSFWKRPFCLFYISTRVSTPCSLLAGSLLNCTKFGVSFLMVEKTLQNGLLVWMSSTP